MILNKTGGIAKISAEIVAVVLVIVLICKVCIPQSDTVIEIGNKANTSLERLSDAME